MKTLLTISEGTADIWATMTQQRGKITWIDLLLGSILYKNPLELINLIQSESCP